VTTHAANVGHTEHVHRDDVGSRLGMWIFLFTELILFGGMFIVYAVYRYTYPQEFQLAARELDTLLGTINTIILLTSSLTAAMSITAMQEGKKDLTLLFLGVTILLAGLFLVNKYFEWGHKFDVGLYPRSPEMMLLPSGEVLYFGLYYVMTGLHGLHVVIGMALLGWVARQVATGSVHQGSYVRLESAALYWHLVDIIWIFLFPLFYLLH
jgi:cytochrome c oxidase subunit 3